MPFLPRHRVERCAETATRPGPDFDEHQYAAVPRDDVQFATAGAKAAIQDPVSPPLQLLAREIFAKPAEGAPSVHARRGAKWTPNPDAVRVEG